MFEPNFEQAFRMELEQMGPTQIQLKEVVQQVEQEKLAKKVGRKSVRRVGRTALAAAVVCALVTAAGAVGIAISQSRVHFFDDEQELLQQAEEDGGGYYTTCLGGDFDPAQLVKENEQNWNNYAGGTLLEERQGGETDGWTAMRAFGFQKGETACRAELYQSEKLSNLNGLWTTPGWDVSWLEEHYEAIPGTCLYQSETDLERDDLVYQSFIGGYQREDGASFTLSYSWFSQAKQVEDRYFLGEGENYTTQDGVTVAITMVTTESGQRQFWAELFSGHMVWTMHGAGLTLEEIQEVADHMGLAVLCEPA
ncbi:MAG: hypothetical protein MSB10_00340 [Clostridiales bacterium]|uniref:hypothetical protein n=1 Tax=Flavonifractor porci TaxID=3133422 RepID=UPI003098ADCD|nr:hypothetical protein [Clostridiales bacterium]